MSIEASMADFPEISRPNPNCAAVAELASDVQIEFLEYFWILNYEPRADD
jgi:hypothetical protein